MNTQSYKVTIGINGVSPIEEQDPQVATGSIIGYVDITRKDGQPLPASFDKNKALEAQQGEGIVLFDVDIADAMQVIAKNHNIDEQTAKAAATLFVAGFEDEAKRLVSMSEKK
ncbi:TPA: hypothetical protein I7730_16150 [Vibrio vulnificus]|uniref:Uncharacterized protein n=1 Tax=Vibrio vulnificus TaxID=672 RepID=A0A8H9TGC2_VIBVL|nr:hypothetical protein [Vibrio vulnificus]HAS8541316.1 hypothetical protein [Vibrio vulnificus]